jgi:23S rRNA (uracil1939-C5)-methyltransferase
VLNPGQIILLEIEKPAAGGRMIARADGQVVLVSGAVPGERATVQIERVGKGVAYAQVVSVEETSPDRRTPFVDPSCGGCLYAHIAYPRQLAIKSQVIADALGRIGRIAWPAPVTVAASPDEGYRMRSRLHIRNRRIGFFREGSHDLCDPRATRQLLPATCDALDRMEARLGSLIEIGGELEVSENVEATERVVHLESTSVVPPEQWARVTADIGLTGVTVSRQVGGDQHAIVVAGDPHVTDALLIEGHQIALRRHVLAFFQGNRFLLHDLVTHVVTQMAPGDEVIDLYAGTGLFSVAAAIVRGAHVTAVEGDRIAAADLQGNTAGLSGAVNAVHQSVEMFTARHQPAPAVLIVDPPRTGMSKASLHGAIGLRARTVIYVSCDVATLARDARRLLDAGYEVQRIDAFDLFPNTPHVETVITFRKI